jgi:hypothetical protein
MLIGTLKVWEFRWPASLAHERYRRLGAADRSDFDDMRTVHLAIVPKASAVMRWTAPALNRNAADATSSERMPIAGSQSGL